MTSFCVQLQVFNFRRRRHKIDGAATTMTMASARRRQRRHPIVTTNAMNLPTMLLLVLGCVAPLVVSWVPSYPHTNSADTFGTATRCRPGARTCSVSCGFRPKSSSLSAAADEHGNGDNQTIQKAPTLNGKMVLPYKVIMAGLKGHEVSAVYAVLNSNYKKKRGAGDGWEHCEYVGVTRNLEEALELHREEHGTSSVAHVRALSFSFPQADAMKEVASQWKEQCHQACGAEHQLKEWNNKGMDMLNDRAELADLMERTAFFSDDEEDDDDEWDEEEEELRAELQSSSSSTANGSPSPPDDIVSPFEKSDDKTVESSSETDRTITPSPTSESALSSTTLPFTLNSVDEILDEVRPYLISDGGNVSVERVDPDTKDVYLKLEGACGSCPSSTVTMQMGIERVLKENFPDLGQVLQVQDDEDDKVTELTYEAVEVEVNRIKPAIIAMGGVVSIVKVDPIGVVELKFQGSNKVRQGLELAIRDVEFVKHVEFAM